MSSSTSVCSDRPRDSIIGILLSGKEYFYGGGVWERTAGAVKVRVGVGILRRGSSIYYLKSRHNMDEGQMEIIVARAIAEHSARDIAANHGARCQIGEDSWRMARGGRTAEDRQTRR